MIDVALIVSASVLAASALIGIVGSSLYSLMQGSQRVLDKHTNAVLRKKRPLITAIITTRNSENTIAACLKSLLASRYQNLEVIVADRGSKDKTKQIVQRFIKDHPRKQIKFIQIANSKPSEVELAAGRTKDQIIFSLSDRSVIKKDALKQAANYFNHSTSLGLLLSTEMISSSNSISGLYELYSQKLHSVSMKASCLLNASYYINSPNVFYRAGELKGLKMALADDVIVYTAPTSLHKLVGLRVLRQNLMVRSMYKLKAWQDLKSFIWALTQIVSLAVLNLAYLALPIILGYFIYLSVSLHEPDFLEVSLVALAIYLVFAIYQSAQLSVINKLLLSVLAPVYFSWWCLTSVVRYLLITTVGFDALRRGWSNF